MSTEMEPVDGKTIEQFFDGLRDEIYELRAGNATGALPDAIAQALTPFLDKTKEILEEKGGNPVELTKVLHAHVASFEKLLRSAQRRTGSTYRVPITLLGVHGELGGKRHGKKHGRPVKVIGDGDKRRIEVTSPKGTQLVLGAPAKMVATVGTGDTGAAIAEMVAAHTGPMVSRMGHVIFHLAFKHAADEGRTPDGRFWFTPSIVADELGIPRQANGKHAPRVSKDATKAIRQHFDAYVHAEINESWIGRDGRKHTVKAQIAHLTTKEHFVRTPGKAGREGRIEYQILKDVWDLTKRYYAVMPSGLLHAQGERQDVWASCIRLYEVAAVHARHNAAAAASDEALSLSVEEMLTKGNLFSERMRDGEAAQKLMGYMDRLKKRGFLDFSTVTMKDGRPGISFRLPQARVAELAQVVDERKRLLSGNARPRRG